MVAVVEPVSVSRCRSKSPNTRRRCVPSKLPVCAKKLPCVEIWSAEATAAPSMSKASLFRNAKAVVLPSCIFARLVKNRSRALRVRRVLLDKALLRERCASLVMTERIVASFAANSEAGPPDAIESVLEAVFALPAVSVTKLAAMLIDTVVSSVGVTVKV